MCMLLGFKPRVLDMLGYCFTTELYAQSPSFILNTV